MAMSSRSSRSSVVAEEMPAVIPRVAYIRLDISPSNKILRGLVYAAIDIRSKAIGYPCRFAALIRCL